MWLEASVMKDFDLFCRVVLQVQIIVQYVATGQFEVCSHGCNLANLQIACNFFNHHVMVKSMWHYQMLFQLHLINLIMKSFKNIGKDICKYSNYKNNLKLQLCIAYYAINETCL